jgi:hypothetical protein
VGEPATNENVSNDTPWRRILADGNVVTDCKRITGDEATGSASTKEIGDINRSISDESSQFEESRVPNPAASSQGCRGHLFLRKQSQRSGGFLLNSELENIRQ